MRRLFTPERVATRKKGRFSEEQIIGILKHHEAGQKVVDLAQEHGLAFRRTLASFDGALVFGGTVAIGERFWLLSYKGKPRGKREQKEREVFADFVEDHLGVEVQFCPVLPAPCSLKCSIRGQCQQNG